MPTEAVLAEMRAERSAGAISGRNAQGRLNRLEKHLLEKPWQKAREGVQVKLLAEDGELYVFAQSADRVTKERADAPAAAEMAVEAARQARRHEGLARGTADEARRRALQGADRMAPGRCRDRQAERRASPSRSIATNCANARRREGRYLLRTNLTDNRSRPAYGSTTSQLVAVEEAFKNLKGDLAIRPIFHQDEQRIEAHIFIAFLAYCLQSP